MSNAFVTENCGHTSEKSASHVKSKGTIWLTGLPGAGKTTLANILHQKLKAKGEHKNGKFI
jgi:adenylylsulfate kinase-like enzyme